MVIDLEHRATLGVVGAPTTTVEGRAPTVRFLPGGELLVVYPRNPLTDADGRTGIYPLDSRHLVEIICGAVGRSPTAEDWRQFVDDSPQDNLSRGAVVRIREEIV